MDGGIMAGHKLYRAPLASGRAFASRLASAGRLVKSLALPTLFSFLLLFAFGCIATTLERSDSDAFAWDGEAAISALLVYEGLCNDRYVADSIQLNNFYNMQNYLNQLNTNYLLQQQNQILIRHNMGLRY